MVAAFALGHATAAHTDVVLDLGKGVYNPSLVVYQVSLGSHGRPLLWEWTLPLNQAHELWFLHRTCGLRLRTISGNQSCSWVCSSDA